MNCDFCLFEFGSTSLKFYYRLREHREVQVFKQPWTIGHEVFRTRLIPKSSMDQAVAAVSRIRGLFEPHRGLRRTIAFATGVFRIAQNSLDFLATLQARVGLKIRILSADEEAALLQSSYLDAGLPVPGFVFDLGGGSLEWVHFASRELRSRGSIGLGAIRLSRLVQGLDQNLTELTHEIVDRFLLDLPVLNIDRIRATGGTARAIVRVLGKTPVTRDDLSRLEGRVRREGPPATLRPHRRPLFLAGVVIVQRLMREVRATTLLYDRLSIGSALLRKVLPYYRRDAGAPSASTIFRRIGRSTAFSTESQASGIPRVS